MSLVLFVGIAVVSAALWHRFNQRYLLASLCSAATSVILFQAAAYLQEGHLDALVLIAIVVSAMLAFAIALLLGLPIRARRARQASSRAA